MKTCIVCGNQMPEDEMVCGRCGFLTKRRRFLSERHYRAWIQETVEPARLNWQRQELERQRRELERQRESAEKDKPPKKTGGFVKNALIAVVVFVLASAVGKTLIAPNLTPSVDSDSTARSSSVTTPDSPDASSAVFPLDTVKEDELTPEEVNAYGEELGVDLDLFENLPMESVEAAQQWLDENAYEYEKSEAKDGSGQISLEITPRDGSDWRIFYGYMTSGSMESSRLVINPNSGKIESTDGIDNVLSLLHFRGYMTGESAVWTYYDGNEQYYLAEDSLQRILCMDVSEDTVAADVEMILPLLTEWNPSGEQSMEDWLTENHCAWEWNDDDSQYTITAGNWEGTLFDDDDKLSLCRYVGNPDDYYLELNSRLIEMGYTKNEETTKRLSTKVPQDTEASCVYKKGEDEIWVSCDFSMHYLQIYL